MFVLNLLLFIFILGIIVFIHELGHFLWAKKFGVHIYEFSIGMGPVVFRKKGKDGIDYNVRVFPIGGFVSMAGEVYEDGEKIPKDKYLCNKPVWQRIIVMAAGVVNNFILAIVLLFLIGSIWGSYSLKPKIGYLEKDLPMDKAGIKVGDEILAINGKTVRTIDEAKIRLYFKSKKHIFKVKRNNGQIKEIKVTPNMKKDKKMGEIPEYGFNFEYKETHGILNKIKYAFAEFWSIVKSMLLTLVGLFSGKISINALSGPVGIYGVVKESVSLGLSTVISLIAYLSINVGVINILPFPAFDGGRIFFLIIEKIKGSPVNQKFENWCHTIGFILLILLIIYITAHDIINLF